ncbi:hypothetical protein [Cellulomonas timonensis]|uniref:hypothetical protein n=1 Tax=Cellulomonas timonensis TaxID=1689271 RepID=UPI0008343476|nr:hypothetical protein [Cellulomonas timonensis]
MASPGSEAGAGLAAAALPRASASTLTAAVARPTPSLGTATPPMRLLRAAAPLGGSPVVAQHPAEPAVRTAGARVAGRSVQRAFLPAALDGRRIGNGRVGHAVGNGPAAPGGAPVGTAPLGVATRGAGASERGVLRRRIGAAGPLRSFAGAPGQHVAAPASGPRPRTQAPRRPTAPGWPIGPTDARATGTPAALAESPATRDAQGPAWAAKPRASRATLASVTGVPDATHHHVAAGRPGRARHAEQGPLRRSPLLGGLLASSAVAPPRGSAPARTATTARVGSALRTGAGNALPTGADNAPPPVPAIARASAGGSPGTSATVRRSLDRAAMAWLMDAPTSTPERQAPMSHALADAPPLPRSAAPAPASAAGLDEATMARIVDAVVDRVEARLSDEVERRAHRAGRGVF